MGDSLSYLDNLLIEHIVEGYNSNFTGCIQQQFNVLFI